MTEQAWWVVALVAVIITGVIGFFIGRQTANSKEKIDELEEALGREKAALADYRDKVDAHFDKTAGLFVSMAGSYKDLFDHLSSGYENLAPGASRELFKDRVSALLLESRPPELTPVGPLGGGIVTAVGDPLPAAAATLASEPEAPAASVEPSAAAQDDSAPAAVEAPALTLEKAESASAEAAPGSDADLTSPASPAVDGVASTPVAGADVGVDAAVTPTPTPAAVDSAPATEQGKKPAA